MFKYTFQDLITVEDMERNREAVDKEALRALLSAQQKNPISKKRTNPQFPFYKTPNNKFVKKSLS